MVEHLPSKQDVAGSSPVSRSKHASDRKRELFEFLDARLLQAKQVMSSHRSSRILIVRFLLEARDTPWFCLPSWPCYTLAGREPSERLVTLKWSWAAAIRSGGDAIRDVLLIPRLPN